MRLLRLAPAVVAALVIAGCGGAPAEPAAAVPSDLPAPTAVPNTPTPQPTATATATPTNTPTPSLTPTVAPPASSVIKKGELWGNPRVAKLSFGVLCVGDIVDVLSRSIEGRDTWYRVRVKQLGRENCDPSRVAVGAQGWELGALTTLTYSFDDYVQAAHLTLPTPLPPEQPAVAPPTDTPEPVYVPRVRVGAICRDGTRSTATGRGACSYHGGVAEWLYK